MTTLTIIDFMQIQEFVFASNRLSDIVAGSLLVEMAADQFVKESLTEDGEVIVAAGGNVLLRFNELNSARAFITKYTRRLYDDAPGLAVAVAHKEITSDFIESYEQLLVKIRDAKDSARGSLLLGGFSVNESCRETGHPAVARDQGSPISRSILRRRDPALRNASARRWKDMLNTVRTGGASGSDIEFDFPLDLDQLGRSKGKVSLIGVVHIDGNNMGEHLRNIRSQWKQKNLSDDQIVERMRKVSEEIKELGKRSLAASLNSITEAVRYSPKHMRYAIQSEATGREFLLENGEEKIFLPIRPILLGGDDITLVCDARIAHSVSETILREFERTPITEIGVITGSAGISFVRSHSPISRAYSRSEEICRLAKRWRSEQLVVGHEVGSVIDWHIERGGILDSLDRIRESYLVAYSPDGASRRLTCKPYPLHTRDSEEAGSWTWLTRAFLLDNKRGLLQGIWRNHKNKIHELQKAAPRGRNEIRTLIETWQVAIPELGLVKEADDGYIGDRTPILDAAEMIELYHPLGGMSNE